MHSHAQDDVWFGRISRLRGGQCKRAQGAEEGGFHRGFLMRCGVGGFIPEHNGWITIHLSSQVKQQGLAIGGGSDGERALRLRMRGIAVPQGFAVDRKFSADHLQPEAATFRDVMTQCVACFQADPIDIRVLVDQCRIIATIRRDHQHLFFMVAARMRMPLGVGRIESVFPRRDPDLQKPGLACFAGVELAVGHSRTRAHQLNLPGRKSAAIAHAVVVFQLSLHHITEDLHVAVRMGGETSACRDPILIDDPQRAKAHVLRVVVIGETEGMVGVEPAVVGMAARE